MFHGAEKGIVGGRFLREEEAVRIATRTATKARDLG